MCVYRVVLQGERAVYWWSGNSPRPGEIGFLRILSFHRRSGEVYFGFEGYFG